MWFLKFYEHLVQPFCIFACQGWDTFVGCSFFLSGESWEKSVARLVTKWFWDKSSLDYVMNISNHGNCQTKLKDVGDNKRIYESPRLK